MHLFYTLRMIFNHLAPPACQIPGCQRWAGVAEMDIAYLTTAASLMAAELRRRLTEDPPPPWMAAQIAHIAQVISMMARPGLN